MSFQLSHALLTVAEPRLSITVALAFGLCVQCMHSPVVPAFEVHTALSALILLVTPAYRQGPLPEAPPHRFAEGEGAEEAE